MKYLIKIKEIFNRILLFYYRIVKIHTGYRIPNKLFLILIIIVSVASIFLRNDFLVVYKDNYFILSMLFFMGVLNILFIQFNLLCRITITLYKGIPYFHKTIKWCTTYGYIGLSYYKKLYFSFLILNLYLIVMGVVVLIRLYSIIYTYDLSLFQMILVYNILISLFLYFSYINRNIDHYDFKGKIILGEDENLSFITKLILLLLPTLILLNLFSYFDVNLIPKISIIKTIYCDPKDGNGNSQTNENIQETSDTNNKNNKNLQGNKNTQVRGTTNTTVNTTNINNQFNQNQQINTQLNSPISEVNTIKYQYFDHIRNLYLNHSFWENIIFLESLRDKLILPNSFITERINFILGEALEKSSFNQYFYNNPNLKNLQLLLCPDYLYFRYNLVPVYFNNYYEVYHLFIKNNRLTFNMVYSIHNKCFNLFEVYQYIKENNKLPLPRLSKNVNNTILHTISTTILKVTRGLISPDSLTIHPNNRIFDAYNNAVICGQIQKLEGVNIKKVFEFNLIVTIGPGRGYTGYYLLDNVDQLKYLIIEEIKLTQSNWEALVDSPMAIDVIKRSHILSNEYMLTGTLNCNLKNIDLLLEFNYSNNKFMGYIPDKYTSPEIRREFNNMLMEFKKKIIIFKVIKEYLSRN